MQRRRSVRVRILVLVLIPVVALVALYGVVVSLTLGQLLALRQAADVRAAITIPTTKVQLALAAERRIAVAYLAGPGNPEPPTAMAIQQGATDAAVAAFDHAVARTLPGAGSPERRAILTFQQALSTLASSRAYVASRRLTANDAADTYSSIISAGNNVLTQAILPLVSGAFGTQALDVVSLDESLQATMEEGDLVSADLAVGSFSAADMTLISTLAGSRHQLFVEAYPGLDPALKHDVVAAIPTAAAFQLSAMEAQIEAGGRAALRVPPRAWSGAETGYVNGFRRAIVNADQTLQAAAQNQADSVLLRLVLGGVGGLLAIGVAIGVAIVVSRGLLRQLSDLRLGALDLASRGLPTAIARLRAGDDLPDEPQPVLLDASSDEIGEVRQAFNAAAQTAVAAAVEEIRIRRGVNDVFRNLARRNQSLLTRQLELLDGMERRAHDPEQLADLFRIDHLTTRMRRHAEGLLIMAGGSSGRTWRDPVPLVDVMRAAIAEVESYTRIRVASRTSAALAGHAVADIIHLLAELLENATIFSPANTPVRIDGDRVARGLALEIEDRGLGMSEERLTEINATMANPPLFDMSGSDQLGLFIVGLLARRHDIKVTLRASAYGGIVAVVLIPRTLVVDAAADGELGAAPTIRELGGRPVAELPSGEPAVQSEADLAAPAVIPAPAVSVGAITEADLVAPGTDGTSRDRTARTAVITGSRFTFDSGEAPRSGKLPEQAEIEGLPVRVRQANLAPQLADQERAEYSPREPRPEESPEAARTTMSAWQRGWERGRRASEQLAPEAGADGQDDDQAGAAAPSTPGDGS
jgi:hypothetical protein